MRPPQKCLRTGLRIYHAVCVISVVDFNFVVVVVIVGIVVVVVIVFFGGGGKEEEGTISRFVRRGAFADRSS